MAAYTTGLIAALLIGSEFLSLGAQPSRPLTPYEQLQLVRPPAQRFPSRQWDDGRRISFSMTNFHIAANSALATLEVGEEAPSDIAVFVSRLDSPATNTHPPFGTLMPGGAPGTGASLGAARATLDALRGRLGSQRIDWEHAKWIPFTREVLIDLGPGDGKRQVTIGARWGNLRKASGTSVWVDHKPPSVTITNPVESVGSQPLIQLQGYLDEEVQLLRYDLINASNRIEDAQGLVNHNEFDPVRFETTRSYFTCYDLELAPGTNTVILRCMDLAGNLSTNRYTFVFTLEHDRTPPKFSVNSPVSGEQLCGGTFTVRGRMDDPTARMVAVSWAEGRTNEVEGLVERDGYYWVEKIPLLPGSNHITLTATDAAGNLSQTNLYVRKSTDVLTIDRVPDEQLLLMYARVTGRVSPVNQAVWVNGVQARVKPDGTWLADRVPVESPNGGTAVFQATSLPSTNAPRPASATNQPAPPAKPQDLVAVVASLGTTDLVLNASQPSCGTFNLQLTRTAGRSFVLLTSTNLAHWTPILTNASSGDTFEFSDPNPSGSSCRFFRVSPMP